MVQRGQDMDAEQQSDQIGRQPVDQEQGETTATGTASTGKLSIRPISGGTWSGWREPRRRTVEAGGRPIEFLP